jgi:hypothetical protein
LGTFSPKLRKIGEKVPNFFAVGLNTPPQFLSAIIASLKFGLLIPTPFLSALMTKISFGFLTPPPQFLLALMAKKRVGYTPIYFVKSYRI